MSGENPLFSYAKTKPQISPVVTAQLISAFVFATEIVRSLHFLNLKFQASSYLLWLHSPVCVGPCQKPRRPVFSRHGSYYTWRSLHTGRLPLLCCNSCCLCCAADTSRRCRGRLSIGDKGLSMPFLTKSSIFSSEMIYF